MLSLARVRRVRRGSISSELLMSGGGVRSILLLPLVDIISSLLPFKHHISTLFPYNYFLTRSIFIIWNLCEMSAGFAGSRERPDTKRINRTLSSLENCSSVIQSHCTSVCCSSMSRYLNRSHNPVSSASTYHHPI